MSNACNSCHGQGSTRCGTCGGSGRYTPLYSDRPGPCSGCGGSGRINCGSCSGRGYRN